MSTEQMQELVMTIEQEIEVVAPVAEVYRAMVRRLSDLNTGGGDEAMPMVLEERPGGRWFRDLGDDAGHLWGFVQAIRPPTLIEICGPLFMSEAVANNLQIRLEETDGRTKVSLRHQALGALPPDYREGLAAGWGRMFEGVKAACEG